MVQIKSGLRAAVELAVGQLELMVGLLEDPAENKATSQQVWIYFQGACEALAGLIKSVEGNLDAFENATKNIRKSPK